MLMVIVLLLEPEPVWLSPCRANGSSTAGNGITRARLAALALAGKQPTEGECSGRCDANDLPRLFVNILIGQCTALA